MTADPHHLLEMAERVETVVRRAPDPDAALAAAFRKARVRMPVEDRPRVYLLLDLVTKLQGKRLSALLHWLRRQVAGKKALLLNRPASEGPLKRNAEAEKLSKLLNTIAERRAEGEADGATDVVDLMGGELSEDGTRRVQKRCPGFDYHVADRRWNAWVAREEVCSTRKCVLPAKVRCLLTYPLGTPHLFTIDTQKDMYGYKGDSTVPGWSLDRICNAITDAYEYIYSRPGDFGIWGHDIGDLFVETLDYYPELQVIYPGMGS